MCGIAGMVGRGSTRSAVEAMVGAQRHRGPDAEGIFVDESPEAVLGHNRLAIIDLSPAGRQPMSSADGRLTLVYNGEIYNYLELRAALSDYPFRTRTDSEVILAAYERWGEACLDRFIGMFAFLLWDARDRRLFAARDRFGVKPLYYHVRRDGTLIAASEIKALHAAGVDAEPDETTWATYLTYGVHDHQERTFWRDVKSLPAGHALTWRDGRCELSCWYDVAERTGRDDDTRSDADVEEEYVALLTDTVRLRFRADVPVGVNLSGGLDSSTLLAAVHAVQGADSDVMAFTFVTGDPEYDELPWVRQMLDRTNHPLIACALSPADVPDLSASLHAVQDEPFGGLPTLAYARLFEHARQRGVIVLLDGQGMDEQWAGYDYYRNAADANQAAPLCAPVQGATARPTRPDCLTPEFRARAVPFEAPKPYPDALRNLQYRDTRFAKIPRALRFNDRASMRSSTELREPFLDHRLFELALRQPAQRKISADTGKIFLRRIAQRMVPTGVVSAPKRPLQTPQREWLRGPLKDWMLETIQSALSGVFSSWLDGPATMASVNAYLAGGGDNSFYLWQWISLGLTQQAQRSHV